MAQQNPAAFAEPASFDETPAPDTSDASNSVASAANLQIIPAAASEPAAAPKNSISFTAAEESSSEADPFGNEDSVSSRPKPKMPTSIPDSKTSFSDVKESGFSDPTPKKLAPVAQTELPVSDSSTNTEFDPFAADEPTPRKVTAGTLPTDVASKSTQTDSEDPFSTPEIRPQQPARTALPTELDSDPFAAAPTQQESTFESPTVVSTPVRPTQKLPTTADAELDDPFESPKQIETSKASVPRLDAPSAGSAPSFETRRDISEPAFGTEISVTQFDQGSAQTTTNSPTTAKPKTQPFQEPRQEGPFRTADSRVDNASPKSNDDRFGGFRPAGAGQFPTTSVSSDTTLTTPEIAVGSGTPAPRRPAPISEIDEDFSPRSSSTPLIAGDTYQVEPNDNFWTISRKKYGTGRYFMASRSAQRKRHHGSEADASGSHNRHTLARCTRTGVCRLHSEGWPRKPHSSRWIDEHEIKRRRRGIRLFHGTRR